MAHQQVMSQRRGKKEGQRGVLGEVQGILWKPQNFVVSQAKHFCLHSSCKQNMGGSFSFIPHLVPSGSSGSVKSVTAPGMQE